MSVHSPRRLRVRDVHAQLVSPVVSYASEFTSDKRVEVVGRVVGSDDHKEWTFLTLEDSQDAKLVIRARVPRISDVWKRSNVVVRGVPARRST